MEQSTAQRKLVKSPPELWAEVSSEDALNRHLSEFGEIRITRVEPETTVAWEGDRASGTVELAPAGWGTKVVLTATPATEPVAAESQPAPEPPAPEPEPAPERFVMPKLVAPIKVEAPPAPAPAPDRKGFFARLFNRPAATIPPPVDPSPPVPTPDPSPPAPPTPAPGPTPVPDPAPPTPAPDPTPPPQIRAAALDPSRTTAILTEVLDDLGAAHHRPFSRD
jgi:hypothetical protein